jgi:hypothetical protein
MDLVSEIQFYLKKAIYRCQWFLPKDDMRLEITPVVGQVIGIRDVILN